ncbi:MAG: aminotransferase class V-fold PLP-dependent enzyme [Gammaproteobacteria bacterium]|nr:aminotransferase class V-fold PLP-dependent enzyme [Gammaproteobacteria bacterium]
MSEDTRFETLAVHAGRRVDSHTGAVAPGIALSSVYSPDAGSDYNYSRVDNPNRRRLEACLAQLEGGTACACFASGVAAASAVLHALAPGDRVLVTEDVYYGNRLLLTRELARWGLEVVFVDTTDITAVKAACTPRTRLIWAETPSNPMLRISDIAALAQLAHSRDMRLAVDNTFATPVLQRPLASDADLVVHSATKYFGGHSDVLGGAVIARDDDKFFHRVRSHQITCGAVPSPFDCWLLHRSIATLPLRVRAQCANAHAVAEHLARHPAVAEVRYPGLPQHPQHALAMRQMRAGGAVVSFRPHGGRGAAEAAVAAARLFTRATSLGSVESLIERRATAEGPDSATPPDLIRLSIGVEHAEDLIADLDYALGEGTRFWRDSMSRPADPNARPRMAGPGSE